MSGEKQRLVLVLLAVSAVLLPHRGAEQRDPAAPQGAAVSELAVTHGFAGWLCDVGHGHVCGEVDAPGQSQIQNEPSPVAARFENLVDDPGLPNVEAASVADPIQPITVTVDDGTGPYYRLSDVLDLLREVGPLEWAEPLSWIARCESGRVDLGGQGWYVRAGAKGDGEQSLGSFQNWTGWFDGPNGAVRAGVIPADYDWRDIVTQVRVAIFARQQRGHYGGGGGWTCADMLDIP